MTLVGKKWRGGWCDGLPSLETQPNCVDVTLKLGSAAEVACHFAVSGDRLPNHNEGHQLNGRDALSRKAGLRLGKDSTGVEEYTQTRINFTRFPCCDGIWTRDSLTEGRGANHITTLTCLCPLTILSPNKKPISIAAIKKVSKCWLLDHRIIIQAFKIIYLSIVSTFDKN